MKFEISFILVFTSLFAFGQDKTADIAPLSASRLNDQAILIFQKYSYIPDSVRRSISLLDLAISQDSSFITAHKNKVSLLGFLGLNDDAMLELEETRKYNKLDPELVCIQGYMLEKNGFNKEADLKYREADKMYDYLIGVNQNFMDNSIGKAFLQFFIKGKSAALSEYNRLKRNYNDDKVLLFRSMFYNFDKDEFIRTYKLPLHHSVYSRVIR
jgi:tetratricopeptide (TPR) repeat protein